MSSLDRIRTDVIGSLLRPKVWKQSRVQFDEGRLTAEQLRRVEDEEIRKLVRMQEAAGLDVVTDGEMRRLNFQDSFGSAVSGYATGVEQVTFRATEQSLANDTPHRRFDIPDIDAPGAAVTRRRPAVERLKLVRNIPLEEYRFASQVAKKPVKVTLIGPDRISQRFDWQKSTAVYASMDEFTDDVVAIQRKMIAALVDAGCRYVHIDGPGYTAYVDGPSMEAMRERGEDPMANFARSLRADARLVEGFEDVTFGIHLCRGNQHSMWHREGSYDAIAERLFSELPHQRFLLEYDTPRAGGFEPLRFLPKGRICVLGLVSTKVPRRETVDELRRRIDEAARYAPLESLALSPQCGFSSGAVGNRVSEDDQRRKLEVVVETARKVWG